MKRTYISAGKEFNTQTKHISAPILRKEFICGKEIKNAALEISAAGFYRLFLNGKELTKGYFAPYIFNPDHIVYYDEYDVKDALKEKNVVCILLGNGFNNSLDSGVWGFEQADYRSAPKVFMKITADGRQILATDETFEVYSSPIAFDDYRLGEWYDARLEDKAVLRPGYYRENARRAILADAPKGEYKKCDAQPISAREKLKPINIRKTGKGYLYDFGQNNAGICRLTIDGKEGQRIDLRFGEFTQNGKLEVSNIAALYGIHSELAHRDRYICREGGQTWQPSFTYHGFRYVYVEGIEETQAKEELLEFIVLHSEIPSRGEFSCGDETINAIQRLTRRSDVSNFHYFPTDCPQREKNGWTGDASLSCEQLLYNFDCTVSLREWLNNVRKAQTAEGALPGIVPTDGWGYGNWSGPAWDSVLTEIPYQIYRFTGDKTIIEENSSAILRYFRFLKRKKNADGLIDFGLGDWCEAGTVREDLYRTPVEVTGSLKSIEISKKAEFLFSEIGDTEDEEEVRKFREGLTSAFCKKHIADGRVRCSTQTAQAMALGLKVFSEKEETHAYNRLLELIRGDGDVFRVGIIGAKYLFDVLAEHGDAELALRLIKGPAYPSYGYWLAHGMTTLNEAFVEFEEDKYPDELIRKDGRGQLVSLNHHCWGSISAWFYKYLAGINLLAHDRALIQPRFPRSLDRAAAKFSNGERRIASEWKRENEQITLTVERKYIDYELELPKNFCAEIVKDEEECVVYKLVER